jgi:two-component system, LytTR family, sensor kinase
VSFQNLNELLNEARSLYEQEKNAESADLARKIIKLAEAQGDKMSKAYAINTIGTTFFNQNLYEEALKQYLAAEKILSELGDEKELIPSLINIAIIYNRQQLFDKAIQFYNKALSILGTENVTMLHAQVHNGLGNVFSESGKNSSANFHFEKVLEISWKLDSAYGKAMALSNLACIAIKTLEPEKAMQLAAKTLQISEKENFKMLSASAKSVQADALLLQEKFTEGLNLYHQIIPEIIDLNRDDILHDAYEQMAEAYCKLNDYKNAYWARIELEKVKARIHSLERTRVLNAMQVRFETEKKELAIKELQLANEKIERRKVEAELQSLRSRMNPHFVYNVMNTIQSLVHLDKKDEAMKAVERFAQLNRITLQHSSSNEVTLDEEIALLKNYIETEQLLMNNDLHYEINIDENIETDFTFIPSLLVQPFVENAIKHGLMHSTGEKQLQINFSSLPSGLEITIQDNGIGLTESAKINEKNINKPTSFATAAIQERLSLLNETRKKSISIETCDLSNVSLGSQNGTQVRIVIPNDENV